MDVSMVSSSASQIQAPRPQAPEPTESKKMQRSERTEPSEADQAKIADAARKDEQKRAQPVVNAQGQTTGRIVNTSA